VLDLPDAPQIPGLAFRTYRGQEDIPSMVKVANASVKADLIDVVMSEDDARRDLDKPSNMDPFRDILIAEVEGEVIGYSSTSWRQKLSNTRIYVHYPHLLPSWRGKGIREAMLHYCERHIVERACRHPKNQTKYFEIFANSQPNDWKSILECEGYVPSWYVLELVRPNLEDIPDFPLPKGIEVRPVLPEHYRNVWEAAKEALHDENSYVEERNDDRAYKRQLESRVFSPQLWQIAWDGDEVVGGVHNYVDEDENKAFGRKWGHTEKIFVRRPWRNRGIAKALIARSLRVVRDLGMEAATLDVDSDNPSGAYNLYESLGYERKEEFTFFRKSIC
jgi:GNAT superfamily N-acetyltransferase